MIHVPFINVKTKKNKDGLSLTWCPYSIEEKEESRHRLIFPGRRQPSIFSTRELNYRVRNGNGWILAVIDTDYSSFQGLRPEKQITLLLNLRVYTFLSSFFKLLTRRIIPFRLG